MGKYNISVKYNRCVVLNMWLDGSVLIPPPPPPRMETGLKEIKVGVVFDTHIYRIPIFLRMVLVLKDSFNMQILTVAKC